MLPTRRHLTPRHIYKSLNPQRLHQQPLQPRRLHRFSRDTRPSFVATRRPGTTIIPLSTATARSFSSAAKMSASYKVADLTSLSLAEGQMQEVALEGLEDGKALLIRTGGKVTATSAKCTHFGAPLKNGVLSSDGRLTCPWHGACFSVATGDVEDAPALDPIATFAVEERDGGVWLSGEEASFKAGRKPLSIKCRASGDEKVVVIGGGSATTGAVEELRKGGFKGAITVLSAEERPLDRTKLSKALIGDISKVALRSPEFYTDAGIDLHVDEATSVDFSAKTVGTKSGKTHPYTKLILATGGSPRSLPLPGLKEGELKNVFLLRFISHVQAINDALAAGGEEAKKEVVVIGSSFIGMEVAANLAGQGHRVTVVGMESQPCEAAFGPKLGAVFRALLEAKGVKFHMSAQVSHGSPSERDASAIGAVHLKDGTALPAEVVIEGVGVAPATKFLGGATGGPELLKDGSIKVSEVFEVPSLPGVYAVGDIATYPYKGADVRIEHWNVAQNAGRTAARHINGRATKPFVPVFWSALGMQLRYCGNTAGGYDDVVVDGSLEVGEEKQPSFAAYYVKGDDVVAVATMGKDPVMVQTAELMRRGRMMSKSQLESGKSEAVLKAEI